ncbi:MAG: cofC [Frankiales bacterium]|nr:cofC [Frankiales bacterium]
MPPNDVPPQVERVSWAVVVPVKRLGLAKSRLSGFDAAARSRLALAFAADVVTAAVGCLLVQRVLVVTDDELAARTLAALGATPTPDGGTGGLNAALALSTERVRARHPDVGVAVLPADLPGVRPEDLAAALDAVPLGRRAFICDAEGRGTTLLAASPGCAVAAAYGPDSRLRHLQSGALELAGAPRLRRDVDSSEHLVELTRLGVGRHTSAVLRALA